MDNLLGKGRGKGEGTLRSKKGGGTLLLYLGGGEGSKH